MLNKHQEYNWCATSRSISSVAFSTHILFRLVVLFRSRLTKISWKYAADDNNLQHTLHLTTIFFSFFISVTVCAIIFMYYLYLIHWTQFSVAFLFCEGYKDNNYNASFVPLTFLCVTSPHCFQLTRHLLVLVHLILSDANDIVLLIISLSMEEIYTEQFSIIIKWLLCTNKKTNLAISCTIYSFQTKMNILMANQWKKYWYYTFV